MQPIFKETEIRPDELMRGQAERLANDIKRLAHFRQDFIVVSCPACASNKNVFAFEKNAVPFVECSDCETIFANPRPRPEHLKEYYSASENYAYWNKYIFPASENARREKIFKPRVQKVLEICKRYNINTDTLLEVGTGFGTFCQELKAQNVFRRIIGVEPTPELAKTCRERGIEIIEKPVEELQLNTNFDVIVNFEVIEHLFDPKSFLKKCYALLKQGGIFVVTCPNVKGFDILTLKEKSNAIDNEHINMFHPRSLTKLLEDCGFKVLETQTPGRLDAELVRKKVLANEFSLENQAFLQRILIDDWDRLGETFQNFLSDNGLSSNMLLIARKVLA